MDIKIADYFDERRADQHNDTTTAPSPKRCSKTRSYSPETDILPWVSHNAPTTFQQLVDLRYCLYHRCSRAGFVVSGRIDDEFKLTGRHSELRIVNNKARRLLLCRLRELGRERGWRGAFPKRKPKQTSG